MFKIAWEINVFFFYNTQEQFLFEVIFVLESFMNLLRLIFASTSPKPPSSPQICTFLPPVSLTKKHIAPLSTKQPIWYPQIHRNGRIWKTKKQQFILREVKWIVSIACRNRNERAKSTHASSSSCHFLQTSSFSSLISSTSLVFVSHPDHWYVRFVKDRLKTKFIAKTKRKNRVVERGVGLRRIFVFVILVYLYLKRCCVVTNNQIRMWKIRFFLN